MRSASLILITLCVMLQTTFAGDSAPLTYRVREQGESLTLVSLRLYGNYRRWREIAALNHLDKPYPIHLGQVLMLPAPPTLTPKQGDYAVLEYWRRRFGRDADSVMADVPSDSPRTPASIPSTTPVKVILLNRDDAEKARAAARTPGIKETVVDLKSTTEDPVTGAERPEYRTTFIKPGKQMLEERKLDEAFDHFSKLAFIPRHEIPADDNVIYLEGDQAQRVFDALQKSGRQPAAATDIERRDPKTLHFSDFERKVGKDISCARVPLLDARGKYIKDRRTNRIIYTARCVGYRR